MVSSEGTATTPATLAGVDVSHVQQTVDWEKVAAAGTSFAFLKATQGITVTDAMFAANWSAARAAGLLVGAYHFYQPGDDPSAQAEHFLAVSLYGTAGSAGALPPVLDFETAMESAAGNAEATAQLLADVQVWLTQVSAACGRPCVLYTSPGFWNGLGADNFGGYPLWVAEYGVTTPKPVTGWPSWTFWQYSDSGTVDGITGSVDLDLFAGDLAALRRLTVS